MTPDELRLAAEYLAGFDVIGKELGYQDDPVPLDLAAKLRAMADAAEHPLPPPPEAK